MQCEVMIKMESIQNIQSLFTWRPVYVIINMASSVRNYQHGVLCTYLEVLSHSHLRLSQFSRYIDLSGWRSPHHTPFSLRGRYIPPSHWPSCNMNTHKDTTFTLFVIALNGCDDAWAGKPHVPVGQSWIVSLLRLGGKYSLPG